MKRLSPSAPCRATRTVSAQCVLVGAWYCSPHDLGDTPTAGPAVSSRRELAGPRSHGRKELQPGLGSGRGPCSLRTAFQTWGPAPPGSGCCPSLPRWPRPDFCFRPSWQDRGTLGESRGPGWQHDSRGSACRPAGLTGVPWPVHPRVGPGSGQGVPWLGGWWATQLQATALSGPWSPTAPELLGCALCAQTCTPPAVSPAQAVPAPLGSMWGAPAGRRGALLPRNPGLSGAVRPPAGLQRPDLMTGPCPLRGSEGPWGAGPRRCSGWRRSIWGP